MKIRASLANLIMTRLVPLEGPGYLMRLVFKMPVFFNRIGLRFLIPKHVLIITTTGRVSGKLRQTAVEFWHDPETGCYQIMSGWAGKTDWYRNLQANPHITVQVGKKCFSTQVEPVPQEKVTQTLIEVTRANPGSLKIWSRWVGHTLDGSEDSLRKAAPYFPMLILRPKS
jgi:deazaflavin-dependent oxidoreductase (nitroreductase family)